MQASGATLFKITLGKTNIILIAFGFAKMADDCNDLNGGTIDQFFSLPKLTAILLCKWAISTLDTLG